MIAACVLSFGVMTSLGVQEDERAGSLITVDAVSAFLSSTTDAGSLGRELASWKTAPIYQRLSVSEYLLAFLLDGNTCETVQYRRQEGRHDLNVVAGRAGWALEELLGEKLGTIGRESTKRAREGVHSEARKKVDAYRVRIVKSKMGSKTEESTEVLKARYEGKIKPGITGAEAAKYSGAMARLLAEWFPLGKKIGELQEIVGDPGEKDNEVVSYRFDSGLGGLEYQFKVKEGVIRSVLVIGLD